MATLTEAYVHIHLPHEGRRPVGIIAWEERGRLSSSAFRYARSWLAHPGAFAIDPHHLPLGRAMLVPPDGFDLPNAIRDAGPDRWGRYLIDRRFGRALSELEYVAALGPDRSGALALSDRADGGPRVWTPSGWADPSDERLVLAAAAGAVEDSVSGEDSERLQRFLASGPSLGGARPKAVITHRKRTYVAKFSVSLDTRNEPRIEYATMTLARRAGLDVPRVELIPRVASVGRSAYLIERFDRVRPLQPTRTPTSAESPIPVMSGLTATGMHESDWQVWSYHRLVDAIVRHSPRVEHDLVELFRRMVFNVLVYNNDDHPRNFAFLHAGGDRWMLSPLYDVVPATVSTETFMLAMALGTEGKRASLTNALSEHRRFRLDRSTAQTIIDDMARVVSRWRPHFLRCGVSRRDIARLETSFRPRP